MVPDKGSTCHLRWSLMSLIVYGKEYTMCKLAEVKDTKTFRYFVWLFISAIEEIESSVVRDKTIFFDMYIFLFLSLICYYILGFFYNRLTNDSGNNCLISMDETDYLIVEHGIKFYSQKFKKSGLRYEVSSEKIKWLFWCRHLIVIAYFVTFHLYLLICSPLLFNIPRLEYVFSREIWSK